MKKIIISFCSLILVFGLISPAMAKNGNQKPEEVLGGAVEIEVNEEQSENLDSEAEENYNFESMTTYELFWPITAGKIPGDKLYKLKSWRDKLMGYLFFNSLKKSEYLKNLANKRLVEADRLVEVQRYSYLSETLKVSRDDLEKGLTSLSSAPGDEQQFWLKNEYVKDLQKHLIVLERMKEKAEDKEAIDESLKIIQELIDKYKLMGAPKLRN